MTRAAIRRACTWLVLVAVVANGELPLFASAAQVDPSDVICSAHARDQAPNHGAPAGLPNRNGKSLRCLLCCLVPDRGVADGPKLIAASLPRDDARASAVTGLATAPRRSPSRFPAPPRAPPSAA